MKTKHIYLGLAYISLLLFFVAIVTLWVSGWKEGKSIFIQIAPLLAFAFSYWMFRIAYKKAVKKERPLE